MLRNVAEVIEKAKELISQEQIALAENILLTALKNKKDTKEVYFLLGDIYLQKNALKKAEESFKKSLSLDYQDYLVHLNLDNIHLVNGNLKGADKHFSLVLENSDEFRDVAVPLLGDVHFEQEKYYEAYHFFAILVGSSSLGKLRTGFKAG